MNFYGVIGANYGDEGKGLTVDWLSRTVNPYRVVRFNGGAQAGHTVQLKNGKRHVFSTYGSGTLAGIPTELTQDVIINPYAALVEREKLVGVPLRSNSVYYNYRSPITTPFEVAINQLLETKRGDQRHGSCGLGINETVERHNAMYEAGGRSLCDRLYEPSAVHDAFDWIKSQWVPRRMWSLGFNDEEIKSLLDKSSDYLSAYTDCIQRADQSVFIPTDYDLAELVYEGAQGLALDEELGEFPHVTRSNTGMRNILRDLQGRLNRPGRHVKDKHILWLLFPTRTYLTRHGAGPLPNEDHAVNVLCGKEPLDETNFPNPWQESLRYAPLHVANTCARIKADLERNQWILRTELPNVEVRLRTVLTCCDQVNKVRTVDSKMEPVSWPTLMNLFAEYGVPVAVTSHGPTADHVHVWGDSFIPSHTGGRHI